MEQVVLAPGRIAWLLRGILTMVLCATLPRVGVASGFADVAPDSWAAPYINAIRDAGITQGCAPLLSARTTERQELLSAPRPPAADRRMLRRHRDERAGLSMALNGEQTEG